MGYVGPEWKQRIVADLDSSLNKWLDAVPPHRERVVDLLSFLKI